VRIRAVCGYYMTGWAFWVKAPCVRTYFKHFRGTFCHVHSACNITWFRDLPGLIMQITFICWQHSLNKVVISSLSLSVCLSVCLSVSFTGMHKTDTQNLLYIIHKIIIIIIINNLLIIMTNIFNYWKWWHIHSGEANV